MELAELLAFAVKNKATELWFAPGLPPMLKMDGDPERRRINVPALEGRDFDELLAPLLTSEAKEALKFSGKHEMHHEVAGLGSFGVRISKADAVFVIPPPPARPPAGDGKPGFFRRLFGN